MPTAKELRVIFYEGRKKSKAEQATVISELLTILGVSPIGVKDFKEAWEAIRKALDLLEHKETREASGLAIGDRVIFQEKRPGVISSVRKDGLFQVRLDDGKSVGASPGYLERA